MERWLSSTLSWLIIGPFPRTSWTWAKVANSSLWHIFKAEIPTHSKRGMLLAKETRFSPPNNNWDLLKKECLLSRIWFPLISLKRASLKARTIPIFKRRLRPPPLQHHSRKLSTWRAKVSVSMSRIPSARIPILKSPNCTLIAMFETASYWIIRTWHLPIQSTSDSEERTLALEEALSKKGQPDLQSYLNKLPSRLLPCSWMTKI